MRNLILVVALGWMASGCGQKKTVDEEPVDAALPPYFDAGPLGALYLLTIYPHSTATGESLSCSEGFCGERATHINAPGGMGLVVNDAGLNLSFRARVGSTVTFDGHETKITQPRQDVTFPHLLERFVSMPVHERVLEVDVKVVTPGMKSEAAKSKLELSFMRFRIPKVKDGPVLFPGETAGPANPHKVAYLRGQENNSPPTLIGNENARWRDIDLIALVDQKWGTGAACPPVKSGLGIGGPNPTSIPTTPHLITLHSDVTLYERRTGKVLDQKAFDSTGKCRADDDPDAGIIQGLGALSRGPTTPNQQAEIQAWIASKLDK